MKIEIRLKKGENNESIPRGLVLVTETETEREMIDKIFGANVGKDGLIGTRTVEARLSDGYGEHYLYIIADKIAGEVPDKKLDELIEEYGRLNGKFFQPSTEGLSKQSERIYKAKQATVDYHDKKIGDVAECVAEVYEIINGCSGCKKKLREKWKAGAQT